MVTIINAKGDGFLRRPFSLLTAYQILILPNSKLGFHLPNQRLKLYLALFLAIGVDIPRDAFAIDGRSIPPSPHILADLMDSTCTALAILGLVGLKFHRFMIVASFRHRYT